MRIRHFVCLALLAACTGTSGDSADSDTDETDTTGADSDTGVDVVDADSCDVDAPATGSALFGTAKDGTGAPLGRADVRVQYCRTTCYVARCRGPGVFGFDTLSAGAGSFEIVPLAEGSRLATPFVPLTLAEAAVFEVDAVVPELEPAVTLPATPAALEAAPGLFLTLGTDTLSTPALEPVATEVAAVDAIDVALPLTDLPGEALALFYVSPFDYPAADAEDLDDDGTPDPSPTKGIPVEVTDTWTLGAGNGELWMADYKLLRWVKVGDLAAGSVEGRLAPANRLPRLSTLAVVRKPAL